MTHAKLSPSSSARWLFCTASVKVNASYENKSNSDSEWGTTIHGIGELLLTDKEIPKVVEGLEVDKEMMDCAEEYADYCRNLIKPNSEILVEETFDLSFIAPKTFGTSDFTVLNGTHLDIVDLKTGFGIVNAKDNTQLMLYALGAIHELEVMFDIETVTLHIMQGRANHIDTWDTTVEELYEFEDFANKQAERILSDDVTFCPSKKACQWCNHQTNCDALKAHVNDVVKGGFDNLEDIEGQADLIDVDHIKSILDNADLITGFVKAVQEVALERMQEGVVIDGYKLVEGKTNRKWADEDEVAKYLNRKIKADDLWVKKLIPMTKILKLRPNDKKLQSMLIKPEGKAQIAPLSDKRASLSGISDAFYDEDL